MMAIANPKTSERVLTKERGRVSIGTKVKMHHGTGKKGELIGSEEGILAMQRAEDDQGQIWVWWGKSIGPVLKGKWEGKANKNAHLTISGGGGLVTLPW